MPEYKYNYNPERCDDCGQYLCRCNIVDDQYGKEEIPASRFWVGCPVNCEEHTHHISA